MPVDGKSLVGAIKVSQRVSGICLLSYRAKLQALRTSTSKSPTLPADFHFNSGCNPPNLFASKFSPVLNPIVTSGIVARAETNKDDGGAMQHNHAAAAALRKTGKTTAFGDFLQSFMAEIGQEKEMYYEEKDVMGRETEALAERCMFAFLPGC